VPAGLAEEKRMMNSQPTRTGQRQWVLLCVVVAALGAVLTRSAGALAAIRIELPTVERGLGALTAAAPGIEGRLHRVFTRSERVLARLGAVVNTAATTWLWILASALLFLLVAAVASAIDVRMLDLRHHRASTVARDLGHGVRMFLRILRDRRTPYAPRAVLALALVYWLLPLDLVGDGIPGVGMLDDLLVTIAAAKLFIRICPDAVVEAHAAAVHTET